jgi:hypothetical protein
VRPHLVPERSIAAVTAAPTRFRMENGGLYWTCGDPPYLFPGMEPNQRGGRDVHRDAHAGHFGKMLPLTSVGHPRLIDVPAMLGIDIDAALAESSYACPYTGRRHFALSPVALLLKGTQEGYRHALGRSPFADAFFDPLHCGTSLNSLLTSVAKIDLGPGYTESCNHFDGSPGIEAVYLHLDNGDRLLAAALSWFNK